MRWYDAGVVSSVFLPIVVVVVVVVELQDEARTVESAFVLMEPEQLAADDEEADFFLFNDLLRLDEERVEEELERRDLDALAEEDEDEAAPAIFFLRRLPESSAS